MVGNRLKLATEARKAVQGRIANWVREQPGTQQALCRRLNVSPSQLTVLLMRGWNGARWNTCSMYGNAVAATIRWN